MTEHFEEVKMGESISTQAASEKTAPTGRRAAKAEKAAAEYLKVARWVLAEAEAARQGGRIDEADDKLTKVVGWLKHIVKRWPLTDAAEKARGLLGSMTAPTALAAKGEKKS